MAVEPLHARQDGPADVALVTLAPGIATPWESHADAAESIRLLSGCLCVEMTFAERHVPVDLSEVSGRLSFTIESGVCHRLIAVYHRRPAVFLVTMRHPPVTPVPDGALTRLARIRADETRDAQGGDQDPLDAATAFDCAASEANEGQMRLDPVKSAHGVIAWGLRALELVEAEEPST
jgi:hypothetical protein